MYALRLVDLFFYKLQYELFLAAKSYMFLNAFRQPWLLLPKR